jgi:hypothetical protein
MVKTALTVTQDNTSALKKAVSALVDQKVLIGIPSAGDNRSDSPEFGNAAIGYVAENGSPANNVPARPWLVPGVLDASSQVTAIFEQAGKAVLAGNTLAVEQGLNAAGIVAVNAVKARITAGIPPPLSPRTIAERVAAGFSGVTPYIRTGKFMRAINYVLRRK